MKSAVRAIRFFQAAASEGWRGDATAAFFSGLMKLIKPRGRRIDANLRLVYPERDAAWRRTIQKQVYENLAWTMTELLALQRDEKQAYKWVTPDALGQPVLDEVLNAEKNKRGVLFLTGHFGNWELLGSWYAQRLRESGRQLYVVYQEIHDPDISALVNEYRERGGMNVLPKEASTLELARMLREGAHIAILTDVSWLGGKVLPFMGRPCTNSAGPAVLAMLSGAPVIPVGLYREAPFRHRARFFDPFFMPEEGSRAVRLEKMMLKINRALEKIIKPRPELWFWLHNRWK